MDGATPIQGRIRLRIALATGGKDSLYAIHKAGGADAALILVYDFPRPSPHTLSLGKSVETLLLAGLKVVVARVGKGRERRDTADILRMLGAREIVAGDVYIDEHLEYMEKLAGDAGVRLLEPLWGSDPRELLYREVEDGIKFMVIGGRPEIAERIGSIIDESSIDDFTRRLEDLGFDPLGERGEYHSIVVDSMMHARPLDWVIADRRDYNGYIIVTLI